METTSNAIQVMKEQIVTDNKQKQNVDDSRNVRTNGEPTKYENLIGL